MAGRPKSVIDWAEVDNLLKAQCTGTEIAGHLGIHPNTLYQACEELYKCNFSEYSQQKKESGKAMLRAMQFQTAMEGDKSLLIWLGKQLLDQSDKKELTGKGGKDLIPPRVLTAEEAKQLWNDFDNGKFPKI